MSRFIEGQIAASLFMMLTYIKHLKLSKLGIKIFSDRFLVFCVMHAYLALVTMLIVDIYKNSIIIFH